MRHGGGRTTLPNTDRNDWQTVKVLLPYLRRFRIRIGLALSFMVFAKLANIGVPLALKEIVDALDRPAAEVALTLPLTLLIAYGLLRLGTSLFNELRNAVFARASQGAIRQISLKVFRHLHELSLGFHLDRQTGGLSRDIERGSRSISQLLFYVVFNILPTFFEMIVVCVILLIRYDPRFAVVTAITVTAYFAYTWQITNWRIKFRVRMNEMDSRANTAAIDSLLNYETVKYFGNEDYESRRYDEHLEQWEDASVKSQTSLALLNVGQGVIIAAGLTVLMVMAGQGVIDGHMTLGDFVLVNAFLIQLYIPLNFLGTVFREVQHCLTDMEKMFGLLEVRRDVADAPDARDLSPRDGQVEFRDVDFAYDPERAILSGVSFTIQGGHKVAVVGASGARASRPW